MTIQRSTWPQWPYVIGGKFWQKRKLIHSQGHRDPLHTGVLCPMLAPVGPMATEDISSAVTAIRRGPASADGYPA